MVRLKSWLACGRNSRGAASRGWVLDPTGILAMDCLYAALRALPVGHLERYDFRRTLRVHLHVKPVE
jgi:hypothetical protein